MTDYVFRPSDVLTLETVQADNGRLLKLLHENQDITGIRLDLHKVTHCDSTGLALFIEIKRLCKQKNLRFSIENMPESVGSLAEFCGIDSILGEVV